MFAFLIFGTHFFLLLPAVLIINKVGIYSNFVQVCDIYTMFQQYLENCKKTKKNLLQK